MSNSVDIIDGLVARLNEIEGLAFVRDAWINKAPDNYGVVELAGGGATLWADGILLDQSFFVRISVYVTDGSNAWLNLVQAKLAELELSHAFPTREYLMDPPCVRWVWTVQMYGPLVTELPDAGDGAIEGGTDTGDGAIPADGGGTETGGDTDG